MSELEERATIKVEIEIDTEDHPEMEMVEDVVDETVDVFTYRV